MTAAERLLALLDHLGIGKAHVATQIPADIAGLSMHHAERLGGIVLCTPVRLDPAPFAALAERVLMISGEYGPTFEVCLRAADRLPGVERTVLDSYEALGWSDVGADRSAEIAAAMTSFLLRYTAEKPRAATAEGSHAGISYKIEGSGPALLLLPFFLAPSQWAPVIPELARHSSVVTLGGRHLGGIAALEDRASMPTYRAMFRTLIDLVAPKPGEAILDIGCGAGSLDRLLAQRLGDANPITAIDVNPFWLREAEALAAEDGVAGMIRFVPGNAEAVPFPDHSFDAVFSVTVLEECDADRAIAEMIRVVRPGGRVGIVVRAVGRPQAQFLSGMRPACANYPRGALPRCSKSLAVASSSSASRRRWSEISGADSAKSLSSSALLRRKSIVSRIVPIQTGECHGKFRAALFSISAACSSNSRANSSRFLATVLSVVWRAKRRQRAAFSR